MDPQVLGGAVVEGALAARRVADLRQRHQPGEDLRVRDLAPFDALVDVVLSACPLVGLLEHREVECGVLEFPDGSVRASAIAEIRLPDADSDDHAFYDFDTKYLDDVSEFDIPATLDDDISDRIRELAVSAFRALDCQGLARVDFFVTEEGPVINEINTMPGFTSISMYPKMWAESGIEYSTLISTLIDTALARGTGLR